MLKKLSILFVVFLFACSFSKKKGEITIIDLKLSAMSFEPTLQMTTIDNGARVVFQDDLELYINYSSRYNLENIKDKNGAVVDEKVKSIDTVYRAFIKRKGQAKGMSYAWGKAYKGLGTVVNADSAWATFPFYAKDLDRFSLDIGKPVSVIEAGGKRMEAYVMPHSVGGIDSIYRYFDKSMRHIPYSFSEKYDKLYDSKLYKIMFVINEIPKGVLIPDAAVPRRAYYHEMKVVHEKDTKKYADLFKRFQEDSDRLHLK